MLFIVTAAANVEGQTFLTQRRREEKEKQTQEEEYHICQTKVFLLCTFPFFTTVTFLERTLQHL